MANCKPAALGLLEILHFELFNYIIIFVCNWQFSQSQSHMCIEVFSEELIWAIDKHFWLNVMLLTVVGSKE